MSDFQFNEDVVFVFYVDLADTIGRRVKNLAHGYAHGYGLVHEFEQNDCDFRLNVLVSPTGVDDFQEFMEDVGIDPSYTVCTDEKDAYHAEKCGWHSNLLSECSQCS